MSVSRYFGWVLNFFLQQAVHIGDNPSEIQIAQIFWIYLTTNCPHVVLIIIFQNNNNKVLQSMLKSHLEKIDIKILQRLRNLTNDCINSIVSMHDKGNVPLPPLLHNSSPSKILIKSRLIYLRHSWARVWRLFLLKIFICIVIGIRKNFPFLQVWGSTLPLPHHL